MTSAYFETVPISSIVVDREGRQRKELVKIDILAASIEEVGLINPPVVSKESMTLVAGERRLEACRSLGWTDIPIQYAENLSYEELQLIELEENVKRVDLTWQDYNDAVALFHNYCEKTEESWSQKKTADRLGMSTSHVQNQLLVKKARESKVENVEDAPAFSTALGITRRTNERKQERAVREIDLTEILAPSINEEAPEEFQKEVIVPERRIELLHTDFIEWASSYSGPKFNMLHCDFPYGINATKIGQSGAKAQGGYDDSPETYTTLIDTLLDNQDKLLTEQAHCMFWFSMNYYNMTIEMFEYAGWKVDLFPLIWFRSDNRGILPDPQRGGRRVYETALLMSRGDRKIVRPVGNAVASPISNETHMSQKPDKVLEHFFRMLVDNSTKLLDPTCGSGGALRIAENMGADYALGIEKDKTYYERAKQSLFL